MKTIKKRYLLLIFSLIIIGGLIGYWPKMIQTLTVHRLLSDNDLIQFEVLNKETGYFQSQYQVRANINKKHVISQESNINRMPSPILTIQAHHHWFGGRYEITSRELDLKANLTTNIDIFGGTQVTLHTDLLKIPDLLTLSPMELTFSIQDKQLSYQGTVYQLTLNDLDLDFHQNISARYMHFSGNIDDIDNPLNYKFNLDINSLLSNYSYSLPYPLLKGFRSSFSGKEENGKLSLTTDVRINDIYMKIETISDMHFNATLSDLDVKSLKQARSILKELSTTAVPSVEEPQKVKALRKSIDDFYEQGLQFSINHFRFKKYGDTVESKLSVRFPSGHENILTDYDFSRFWDGLEGKVWVSAPNLFLTYSPYSEELIHAFSQKGTQFKDNNKQVIELDFQEARAIYNDLMRYDSDELQAEWFNWEN